MVCDIELHQLEMNYLEMLVGYIEGETTLTTILQLNERIYKRPVESLSKTLVKATTRIHKLKERLDERGQVNEEEISNAITDAMLHLTTTHVH